MTGQEWIALMPLIIPAGGALLVLLAGAAKPGFYLYEVAITILLAALLWGIAMPVEAAMAGIAITGFSRFFLQILQAAGIVGLLFASGYNRRRGITGEEYPATVLFALVGMGAACAATDLLMLFLGLEAFTFAFYILVAIERNSVQGGEAGLKYLLNGTLSAALIAMGMALVYCSSGSIALADLMAGVKTIDPLFRLGFCLILAGMAFKLSFVPAHLWTADVYQGAPAPVSALLSTASKLAAVAGLMLLLPLASGWSAAIDLLRTLAAASMIVGTLAALVQTNLKRMLAWSSVAQMGYVALAFVVSGSGGLQSAVFYVIVYAVAGLAAFGALSAITDDQEPQAMGDLQGMGYKKPLPAAALCLAMFSLAGFPPTAGFMGKLGVFTAALRNGEIALAVTGMLASIISLFFYLRLAALLYDNKNRETPTGSTPASFSEKLALVICMAGLVLVGFFPSPLLDVIVKLL